MRHHDHNRKFGREKAGREALLRLLAENLIERMRIRTTEAKAKELRPIVEKLVTKAKIPGLAANRYLQSRLKTTKVVTKLTKEIAPKYSQRMGGYTRIVKLPPRKS